MYSTVALVLCLAGTPHPHRPAGATTGTAVAVVLSGKGEVKLRDGKRELKLESGTALIKSDTLLVPPASFVLLEVLENHQVVRVDEDMELAVRDIAVLDAPKASEDVSHQLDRLLTPDERAGFKDRMVGWYADMSAANVVAARQEEALARPEKKSKADRKSASPEMDDEAAPSRRDADAVAPARPPPPAPARDIRPLPPPPPPSPAPAREMRPQPSPPPPPPAPGAPAPAPGAPAPASPSTPPKAGKPVPRLEDCFAKAYVPAWAKARGKLRVYVLQVAGDVRVRIEGGIQVPACALEWFRQNPTGTPGAWTRVDVTIR